MEENVKYGFLMSQLTHIQDVKETEKTKLSIVFYQQKQIACILRVCKNRDLSAVCESLRKIRNPNTVVVYDYVYANGDTYIVEEKLSGHSMEELLADGKRFSEKETAQIMVQVCNALEQLHKTQPPVVHNDINPSNIMLCDDGQIKLFDFDISRLYKQGSNRNTALFGTEDYASPEHFGYGQSEPRTDIYCLGVTMHTMLTGSPLTGEHKMTYSGGLQRIMQKCLEVDPENRYASAAALRKALNVFLTGRKGLFWLWPGLGAAVLTLALLLSLRACTDGKNEPTISTDLQDNTAFADDTTAPEETETTGMTLPEETQSGTPTEETPQTGETTPGAQLPQTGGSQQGQQTGTSTPTVQQPQTGGTTTEVQQPQTGGTTTEVQPPQTGTDTPTVQQPPIDENTGNRSKETAKRMELDRMYAEHMEEKGIEEWYYFHTGSVQDEYVIWIDSMIKNPVEISVYDSNGEVIWGYILYYLDGMGDNGARRTLKPNTDYYIKVETQTLMTTNYGFTGDYWLKVWLYDENDKTNVNNILPIEVGQDRLCRPHAWAPVYYKIPVEKDTEYTVVFNSANMESKVNVTITGANGSRFYEEVDAGECITRTVKADADGWFDICIATDDEDAWGHCSLLITKQ